MSFSILLIVILSAVLHPLWNIIVKRDADPAGAFMLMCSVITGIAIAQTLVAGTPIIPPDGVWGYLVASAVGQAVYGVALTYALNRGDLSAYYPIVRATPVAVVAWTWAVDGASPGWILPAGVVLVVVGGFMTQAGRGKLFDDPKALFAAVISLIASAVFSIADGHAAATLPPSTLMAWAQGGALPIQVVMFALLRMPMRMGGAKGVGRGVLAGAIAYASYYLILLGFAWGGGVAAVTAVRQISIPLSVLMGALWLGERNLRGRLLGSAVVVAGVVLIALNR